VARQRDPRKLIGDHIAGAERLNFSDSLDWQEGRFNTITLEDRNLPLIAERRVLKPRSEAARGELDAAFERTAKVREAVWNTLLTSEGDRQMFRRVYPFSPALVQTLVAVSSVLQRERTALKVMRQLLVDHRDTLQVGDLVPVGDLFDVVAHGDEAFSAEMAIHEDSTGNRKRRVRQMLFEGLGVEDADQFFLTLPFRWRNTERACEVVFANVRDLPDASLEAGDDWRLVIDIPFDEPGHGPRDDLGRLQQFRQSHRGTGVSPVQARTGETPVPRQGSRTLVWVPNFFGEDALKDLGVLVVLEHILAGERFTNYATAGAGAAGEGGPGRQGRDRQPRLAGRGGRWRAMTQPAPTFGQIRARVQAVRRKVPDARAVGIQTPGRCAGERLRADGAETYRIEQCDSPLAARVALLDEEPGVTVTVLVTGLSDKELGEDVIVRLANRKLYAIDSWQIVKELFQAQTVDPRLRSHGWIADRLLDLAAAATPPPAPGGYLDAEAVWPLLLERLIGLTGDRPDLAALLRWSAAADNVQRFRRLPEEPRRAVGDWLATQVGPAATAVLRCAAALDGPDALPVGLVLGVVHHPQAGGRLDRAAGRMERFLGGPTPEAGVLERWHAAATEAVRLPDSDPRTRSQLLHRADEVLREVQAEDFARLSDVLPRGFDQRLARLGDLLGQAVEGGAALDEALREARDAVRRHDQARREPRRLERVEMALRLVRWLTATAGTAEPPSNPRRSRRRPAATWARAASWTGAARCCGRATPSAACRRATPPWWGEARSVARPRTDASPSCSATRRRPVMSPRIPSRSSESSTRS
jgi:hypothetical protein